MFNDFKRSAWLVLASLLCLFSLSSYALQPIAGNEGEFMSPFTSDGVVAEWVNRSINASMASGIGSAAGAYVGQRALNSVPFVGGMLGSRAGQAMGRQAALQAAGGESFMKENSDLSFNSLSEMGEWMYINHRERDDYGDVVKATQAVYPRFAEVYPAAVQRAHHRLTSAGVGLALATDNGAVTVARVFDGEPASAADIQAGDRLIRIDEQFLQGQSLQQVQSMLQGEEGSEVSVTVVRGNEEQLRTSSMVRSQSSQSTIAAQQQNAAARSQFAAGAAPAREPREFDQVGGLGLFLLTTSGDLDVTGLGVHAYMRGIKPRGFFPYADGELFFGSNEDNELFGFNFNFGGSYGINDRFAVYGALGLLNLSGEAMFEETVFFNGMTFTDQEFDDFDFFGYQLRYGVLFRIPGSDFDLDFGFKRVSAEDEDLGSDRELKFTGLRVVGEYRIGGGSLFARYEDLSDDESALFLGGNVRF